MTRDCNDQSLKSHAAAMSIDTASKATSVQQLQSRCQPALGPSRVTYLQVLEYDTEAAAAEAAEAVVK